MSDSSDKMAWRSWAKQVGLLIDWSSVGRQVAEHLERYLRSFDQTVVLTFLPMAREIDLRSLVEASGHRFAVTRTDDQQSLSVHHMDAELEMHSYGFEQPVAGSPVIAIDEIGLAFIPGVAFDRFGTRLGRGRGLFDELLAGLDPSVPRIGVAPAVLVVPHLPAESHDVAMTHLATELEIMTVSQ